MQSPAQPAGMHCGTLPESALGPKVGPRETALRPEQSYLEERT